MPPEESGRVTNDAAQLSRVIQTVFLGRKPKLRDQAGEADVQLIAFQNGKLHIRHTRPPAPIRLLTLIHAGHLMLLECSVDQRLDDGDELLVPKRLHLRPPRRHERIAVEDPESAAIGCVPLEALPESLGHMNRTRDNLIRVFQNALKERLPEGSQIEIRLRRTQRIDPHMRAMQSTRLAIFAPHTIETAPWAMLEPGKFISHQQYAEVRRYEEERRVLGEIAVPLWYRDVFLYGYIHVRAMEPLELPVFDVTAAVADKLHAELMKNHCLPTSEARCPIIDVSERGIGFLYPHKAGYHKAFMPGADLVFDLVREEERCSFTGVLKNIRSLETAHRFGIEFDTLRPEQLEMLVGFLANRADKADRKKTNNSAPDAQRAS